MLTTVQFIVLAFIILALMTYVVILIRSNEKHESKSVFYQGSCQMLRKRLEKFEHMADHAGEPQVSLDRVVKYTNETVIQPDDFGHYIPARNLAVDELLESTRECVKVVTSRDPDLPDSVHLTATIYVLEPK